MKNIRYKMKQAILFFLKNFLFWLAFFLFFKVFFLLYNNGVIHNLSWSDIIGVFTHGFIMDLSAAAYLTVLPGFLISFGFVLFPNICRPIVKYYTLILLVILILMGLGDAGLYQEWGSRLNTQILLYLQNPRGMYAAMNWKQIIALLLCWTGFTWGWFWSYNKFVAPKSKKPILAKWPSIPVILFLTVALILPIRGGVNTSPLNHSSVYFSEKLDANQSAYNYFWNFFYSLEQQQFNQSPIHFMSANQARKIVENNYDPTETYPVYIKQNGKQPINVVLVFLESFSAKVVRPTGGLPNATPRLNQLCKEGILFTNFFSTGNRSDKGMCACIGGYPSVMNGVTVLAFPEKMKKLYYFPKQFRKRGYDLSFYYGGDVNFYNTKTALIQSGFNHIVSNIDYPSNISSIQKWGVPDHLLYARFFNELQHMKKPFFSMVYNISSHEPFDVPNFSKIKGNSDGDKYLNSIAYSDSCLGVFMDKLKASPLWKNTLVIITADHCSLLPEPTSIEDPKSYRIPLLWTGGVVDTNFVCKNIAMQNDLGPTLVQQMGWKDKMPKFSKNIFSKKNYAFYFRNEGWGFVSPSLIMFDNMNSKTKHLFFLKSNQKTDSLINFAKAYIQYLHDDFSKN